MYQKNLTWRPVHNITWRKGMATTSKKQDYTVPVHLMSCNCSTCISDMLGAPRAAVRPPGADGCWTRGTLWSDLQAHIITSLWHKRIAKNCRLIACAFSWAFLDWMLKYAEYIWILRSFRFHGLALSGLTESDLQCFQRCFHSLSTDLHLTVWFRGILRVGNWDPPLRNPQPLWLGWCLLLLCDAQLDTHHLHTLGPHSAVWMGW